MATRKTMNISLTPELSRYVDKRLASGQYTSASELVRESLRLMQKHDGAKQWLRREVMKGLNQARRGELIDGEQALAQLETALFKKRRRKTG